MEDAEFQKKYAKEKKKIDRKLIKEKAKRYKKMAKTVDRSISIFAIILCVAIACLDSFCLNNR